VPSVPFVVNVLCLAVLPVQTIRITKDRRCLLKRDAMLRTVLQGLSGIPGEHNFCIYANSMHGSRGIKEDGKSRIDVRSWHMKTVACGKGRETGVRSQESGVGTKAEARKSKFENGTRRQWQVTSGMWQARMACWAERAPSAKLWSVGDRSILTCGGRTLPPIPKKL